MVPLGVAATNSSEKPSTSSEKPDQSSENSVTGGGNIEMTEGAPGTPEILPYAFYPGQPPTTRQIIYQLCDIRCAEAQKLISENDGRVRKTDCCVYFADSLDTVGVNPATVQHLITLR